MKNQIPTKAKENVTKCGGLTFTGCQVLTELLYYSPPFTGQGEEDKIQNLCGLRERQFNLKKQ